MKKLPKKPELTIEIIQETKTILKDKAFNYDDPCQDGVRRYSYYICDCMFDAVQNIYGVKGTRDSSFGNQVVAKFQKQFLDPTLGAFGQFSQAGGSEQQNQRFMLLCFVEEFLRDKKRNRPAGQKPW
jgi:hypothetical protein